MATDTSCTPALRADREGWKITVTVLTTWTPMFLSMIIRLVLRIRAGLSTFGIDDWTMFFSFIPLSLGSMFHLIAVHYGLGQHYACLNKHNQIEGVKFQFLAEGMNILSVWIVKMSICFFLLRLIQGTHSKTRKFLWSLIIANSTLNISSFILWGLSAIPLEAIWNRSITPSLNINAIVQKYYLRVVFALNVVIDFIFAFSPIYFLWNVNIPRTRKHTIWGLMGLAILPSVAGLLKSILVAGVAGGNDPTFSPVPVDIAALSEQNGGSLVANLPSINRLADKIFIRVARTYRRLLGLSQKSQLSHDGSCYTNTGPSCNSDNFNGVVQLDSSSSIYRTESEPKVPLVSIQKPLWGNSGQQQTDPTLNEVEESGR